MSLSQWLVPSVIIAFPFLVYVIWLRQLKKRTQKLCGHHVHILPQTPIIGNFHTLVTMKNTTEIWDFVTDQCEKHEKGTLFWVFHIAWVFIHELDVVEAILSSQECIKRSYVYSLIDMISDGIVIGKEDKWKKLRKTLNLTFSQKQIDNYQEVFNEQVEICLKVLQKNTGKYVNIKTFVIPYFFDVVFRTHFGVATQEQIKRKYQVTEHVARIFELTMENRFFNLFIHPTITFKMTKLYKFISWSKGAIWKYLLKMIDKRMKQVDLEKDKGVYTDDLKKLYYVDMVRDLMPDFNLEPTKENVHFISADILVAGSDTTSVAVSVALYYLALYQDMQEKVYEEALTIFGESRVKSLTKSDLIRLNYLEMVIKEALRHSSPPGIGRELSHDVNVGKYVLPKGTNTYIVMKAIHFNPKYWERPNEFYPDHFLPEKVKTRPKNAFIPFSMGPRNCPGSTFAFNSMKTLLSTVVRNFKVDTNVPLKDIKYKLIFMKEHKDGYSVRLTPREPL